MPAQMEKGDFLQSLQAFYDIHEKHETSHTQSKTGIHKPLYSSTIFLDCSSLLPLL